MLIGSSCSCFSGLVYVGLCWRGRSGLLRLTWLNAWFPAVGTVGEGLGAVACLGRGVSLGVGFEVSKAPDHPPSCSLLLVSGVDVKAQLFLLPCL